MVPDHLPDTRFWEIPDGTSYVSLDSGKESSFAEAPAGLFSAIKTIWSDMLTDNSLFCTVFLCLPN